MSKNAAPVLTALLVLALSVLAQQSWTGDQQKQGEQSMQGIPVPQNLLGFTATLDYFLGKGQYDKILVRPEFRYDHSTANFFSVGNTAGLTRKYQATLGLGLVYYF